MSHAEREKVMAQVEGVRWGKRRKLGELGIPKSTYYRWRQHQARELGLHKRTWNRLTPEDEAVILTVAGEVPEWRSRQLAIWLTDRTGWAVSESTVYRLLRQEGLVKVTEQQLLAGKEYQHKTTGPHQLWATDASYFRVVGWGYYYLVLPWKDGRLLPVHSGLEAAAGYDGRLPDRGGPRGRGRHGDG